MAASPAVADERLDDNGRRADVRRTGNAPAAMAWPTTPLDQQRHVPSSTHP